MSAGVPVNGSNVALNAAQEEERFALSFQDNPAALAITRLRDGRFIDANRSYEELLGWTREELRARTAFDLDVYGVSGERREIVRRLRETGSVRNQRLRMRSRSGETRYLLASMQIVDWGDEPYILSAATDVTEQYRTEEALRQRELELTFLSDAGAILASSLEYEQTLRTVAELAVPHIADWCAVQILDEDGNIRELAVAHADPGKLDMARELQRRYPPNDEDSGIRQVVRTGQPAIYPEISDEMLAATAHDEEHLALMRQLGLRSIIVVPLIARDRALGAITLVSAESGRRFGDHDVALAENLAHRAALAVDNAFLMTQRAAAEETVRAINAELEQRVHDRTIQLAASNAELEAFAYSVSHDLRAPLRGMDGFSTVLADRYADALDDRGRRYLGHIRDAAQEMGQLIDALLRLARLTRGEMHWKPVNLSSLARSIVEGLRRGEPERGVEISIADGLMVTGDEQLLRVLLENLLGNAWKFSRGREQATITFGVEVIGDEDVYVVRDNGAGFDQRYVDKLFGPFQRLHTVREFEGSGIGLATSQRIVHRHGGRIWAEGKVDEGAAIFFTLPPRVEACA